MATPTDTPPDTPTDARPPTPRRTRSRAPATAAETATTTKVAAKKVAAKTATPKKVATKQTAAKKVTSKKAATRKVAAKKSPPTAPPSAAAGTGIAHGPAHSEIALCGGDLHLLQWRPGHACPPALQQAAAARLDEQGNLRPDDDAAWPLLQRLAAEAGHHLHIAPEVWPHLATQRDARHRLQALHRAYPDGPASAALQRLLRSPLPLFQAEAALWAVVAGRALIADERGLGKGVMAIAAAALWQRHFGVQRVLLLCEPALHATWRRAWRRFMREPGAAPAPAVQVIAGGHHQRQAQWAADPGLRIVSPEALRNDTAHLAEWAPELVIVDEPQRLALAPADWAALTSPHALLLCGAALDEAPALLETLVDWLDPQRQGALAALQQIAVLRDAPGAVAPADDELERLDEHLSRVMLQRGRDEVALQLPARVLSERVLAMAPAQQAWHDERLARARRLLQGWQRSGYLSDADQWRLGQLLRELQAACHRADPADPASTLAEATLSAVAAQLDEWAACDGLRIALLCDSSADRDQLAQRLQLPPNLSLRLAGEPAAADGGATPDVVLRIGVPWRMPSQPLGPLGPYGAAPPGQQWVCLVARHGIDAGLFDTLAGRDGAPDGPAAGGTRGFLSGEALAAWLRAVAATLQSLAADAADASG